MSVTRRSDTGNWLIDFSDRFGRVRKTVNSQQYNKRQVEALERRLRSEREETKGPRRPAAEHRWGDLASRYWTEHGRHLSWHQAVQYHLDALSQSIGDATPLDEITPDLISGIFSRWRGQVADSTLNRRLAVLRGGWNKAAKVWGWPLRTIAWEVLRFDEPETIERNLSVDEVRRLIKFAPRHLAQAIQFALLTGLRRGTILSLKWEDIDNSRKEIVTKSKGQAGGKVVAVPITPALDALLEQIGRRDVGPIIVFRGKPISDLKTAWNKTRARAGLPGVRFHDLRHTFAQDLFDSSGNLSLVQDALHHTSPVHTRRYARRNRDQIREALIEVQKGRNLI